jgi:hypothetical protein
MRYAFFRAYQRMYFAFRVQYYAKTVFIPFGDCISEFRQALVKGITMRRRVSYRLA